MSPETLFPSSSFVGRRHNADPLQLSTTYLTPNGIKPFCGIASMEPRWRQRLHLCTIQHSCSATLQVELSISPLLASRKGGDPVESVVSVWLLYPPPIDPTQ